ncbi:MAG: thermonuclease family protein [Nitrosospira sp.]|nr:thermonuclease family protein [Nitrosospira sp.]
MKGFNLNLALRWTAIAICGFYLSAGRAESFSGKVVGIADGDTLTVLTASKQQHKIRLAEIDAPEKHQPFGTKSKQSLSDLCFGKPAEIIPFAKDRYKRTVARVKCTGIDANAAQVNSGMAWVYRRYAKDPDLYVLENGAKMEKRGLWAESSPVPPWEFRRRVSKNVRPL